MMANWTPEQQKEHRRLWVEALRSGKYRQAEGALKRQGGEMCCLGVACDISGLGKWVPAGEGTKLDFIIDGTVFGPNYLPEPVKNWLGVRTYNPKVRVGDNTTPLALLNDEGVGFAEIADIIASEPEGLLAKPEAA